MKHVESGLYRSLILILGKCYLLSTVVMLPLGLAFDVLRHAIEVGAGRCCAKSEKYVHVGMSCPTDFWRLSFPTCHGERHETKRRG
jgi:hypothetical protein